jgi:phage shock protein A
MAWLSQFSLVMRSSITALREKVEDPERLLHQLILDMDEELCSVRSSVAEAIADEIQMRKRTEREEAEMNKWTERAMLAVKRGDESNAKSALSQKMSIMERYEQYRSQHAKQLAEVNKLQTAVRDLEDKIRQAKQKKTLLTARMARANSTQKINGAIDRTGSQSAFAQFSRLEQKVERQESIVEAWDRMDGNELEASELERKFELEERERAMMLELESLKMQVKTPQP